MNDVYSLLQKKYKNKKVLVVGLGLQGGGVGIASFFAELGAKVVVTDKKNQQQLRPSVEKLKNLPIKFHLGNHELKDFLEADLIFKGPSVPWSMKEIVEAEKKGIPVEMEMSFFASYFPGKIIGITGTRGKSTTTLMIFHLLKNSGFSVFLGGGLPGISTINYLKTLKKTDWVVMELSSWALSGFHKKKISPHIGVFTNLYPDHLNYYQNIDDYFYDKKAIYLYQKENDYLIANQFLKEFIKKDQPRSQVVFFEKKDFPYQLKNLTGDHNLENAASSLKLAKILKIDEKKAIEIISNFQGLPFRQEKIGKIKNIVFINDTTSTTPIATIKAIETFKGKKIILILGGNSKNLPFENLIKKLKAVEKIVLLDGSFTKEIIDKLRYFYNHKISNQVFNLLTDAIDYAYKEALKMSLKFKNEEILILFSPGATSFAMFNNEFHRGEEFNRIVKEIIKNNH